MNHAQIRVHEFSGEPVFVRAIVGPCAPLGVGKQVDRKGKFCSVEYFDTPASDRVVHVLHEAVVKRTRIAEQTRVYHFNESAEIWEVGRSLDDYGDRQLVQFTDRKEDLRPDSLFVRWACPIRDPTPLLATRVNGSLRASDGRRAFLHSQIRQRAASLGISALLSSAVQLEAHQIEVVRRVLQDPIQRYLLADEVGLGKTIEAGILIRQCIIDSNETCVILVVVPSALVGQWVTELTRRFFLGRNLGKNIFVMPSDHYEGVRSILPKTTMLVIDEAHHITGRMAQVTGIYNTIAAAARNIDRVLLLSATPALHNERGFLEMLHLLDPAIYTREDEEGFRQRVTSRQGLAEIVAGLRPENVLYLDYTIDQLHKMFPEDVLMHEYTTELQNVIDMMPEQDDPLLVEAIRRLHAHLSESYRLNRRILRHRRRSVGGLTPDRAGAEIVRYRSNDRAALTEAIDDWRFCEASRLDTEGTEQLWSDRVRAFWQALDRASQYPSQRSGTGIIALFSQTSMAGDPERFNVVNQTLRRAGLFEDRTQALLNALAPLVGNHNKFVIFCSDVMTADNLARCIRTQLNIVVDRHDPTNPAWAEFIDGIGHDVLVCDRRAEEGLNLQGGRKIVVHYDVPFNPNRIEQRLGRTDRYGPGETVRSLVLACEDDPLEMAWVRYLDSALRVFNRSVASLQYLIEQTLQELPQVLFIDGVTALNELSASSEGEQGQIEREIKSIDQQDALDELGKPQSQLVTELSDLDKDWRSLARDTSRWLEKTLHLARIEETRLVSGAGAAAPFRYSYSTLTRHTLIPLPDFEAYCASALQSRRGQPAKTIPYTFSRRIALKRSARANGVGLLRYGDAFISGATAFTEADDRGRSFAVWRFDPDHIGDAIAEFYFRFDFIVEADVAAAAAILTEHGRNTNVARAAIRRRGDMALPPFYHSAWLTRELATVHDDGLCSRLARACAVEPDRTGSVDINLSPKRWQRLLQLQLPELVYWTEFCNKAREAADRALRLDPRLIAVLKGADQRAAQEDQGRVGQLRARARSTAAEGDSIELAFEEQLAAAMRSGIRFPLIRLDTIGAIFVSGNRMATKLILGST